MCEVLQSSLRKKIEEADNLQNKVENYERKLMKQSKILSDIIKDNEEPEEESLNANDLNDDDDIQGDGPVENMEEDKGSYVDLD